MQKGLIDSMKISLITISPLFLILSNPKIPIMPTVCITVVSFDYFIVWNLAADDAVFPLTNLIKSSSLQNDEKSQLAR